MFFSIQLLNRKRLRSQFRNSRFGICSRQKFGQYENYLENLEKNSVAARKSARTKKFIKSFQMVGVTESDDKNDCEFCFGN